MQWAVTMAFYAALHGMTGYLLQRSVQVSNHQARDAAIAAPRNGVPQHVYHAYRRLKGRSVLARYDLGAFTPVQVERLLNGSLRTVFDFVGL